MQKFWFLYILHTCREQDSKVCQMVTITCDETSLIIHCSFCTTFSAPTSPASYKQNFDKGFVSTKTSLFYIAQDTVARWPTILLPTLEHTQFQALKPNEKCVHSQYHYAVLLLRTWTTIPSWRQQWVHVLLTYIGQWSPKPHISHLNNSAIVIIMKEICFQQCYVALFTSHVYYSI